jgi:hypothetical protein
MIIRYPQANPHANENTWTKNLMKIRSRCNGRVNYHGHEIDARNKQKRESSHGFEWLSSPTRGGFREGHKLLI